MVEMIEHYNTLLRYSQDISIKKQKSIILYSAESIFKSITINKTHNAN